MELKDKFILVQTSFEMHVFNGLLKYSWKNAYYENIFHGFLNFLYQSQVDNLSLNFIFPWIFQSTLVY